MDLQVKDGSGGGYKARVTKENKLSVEATTISSLESHSLKGNSFAIETGFLNITTTEGRFLWYKNTSSTQNFHIENILYTWNGGSTNFNRPMYLSLYFGDDQPSGNNVALPIANTNLTSSNNANSILNSWDGVGTGMTIPNPVPFGPKASISQGFSHLNFKGSFIVGSNNTVSIAGRGEEPGIFNVIIFGYFKDK